MQVGELWVKLGLNDGALSQGLDRAKRQLQEVGMVGAGVLAGLGLAMRKAVQENNSLVGAMTGLRSVARAMGQDLGAAEQAARDLATDGLMTVGEASAALKNLLASRFNLPEAIQLMNAFKDSAAFGRQGALGFGEAIVGATEGVKNGNSILVDNAGITKNLSVILQEAGFSAQDLMRASTDASVRQAIFNGILKEAGIFAGDAARATQTFAGQQARAASTTKQSWADLGAAVEPVLRELLGRVMPVVQNIAAWIKVHPELTQKLMVSIGVIGGVTAAMWGLATVLTTIKALINPVGAVVGVLAAVGSAMAINALTTEKGKSAYEEYRRKVEETTGALDKQAGQARITAEALREIHKAQLRFQEREILGELGSMHVKPVDPALAKKYPALIDPDTGERIFGGIRSQSEKRQRELQGKLNDVRNKIAKSDEEAAKAGVEPKPPPTVGGEGGGKSKKTALETAIEGVDFALQHLDNTMREHEAKVEDEKVTVEIVTEKLRIQNETLAATREAIEAVSRTRAKDNEESRKKILYLDELRIKQVEVTKAIKDTMKHLEELMGLEARRSPGLYYATKYIQAQIDKGGVIDFNVAARIANKPFAPSEPVPSVNSNPTLPKRHFGGYIPGPPNREQLALLRGGERVDPNPMGGGGGGPTFQGPVTITLHDPRDLEAAKRFREARLAF